MWIRFFAQLCEKCEKAGKGPMGAFLVGDIQPGTDEEYVYIYGAIQMHDLKMSGNEYVIDEDTGNGHTRTASSILRKERCSDGSWRTRECR